MAATPAGAPGRPSAIPAFRRGRWHESLDTVGVSAGLALSVVPAVVIDADARVASSVVPLAGQPDFTERRRMLQDALDLFDGGDVDCGPFGTQSAHEFRALMRTVAGLPAALTDRWIGILRTQFGVAVRGAAPDAADRGTAGRSGRTLISLPANTFTCLEAIVQSALDGDDVWVRPSRREPVSALRLVAALRQAGWPPDRLGLYPTVPAALSRLMAATDRHIVFGGAELGSRLAGSPGLDLRGPGRGLAVVPAGTAPDRAAAWLLPLLAADSGRFCSNVCTVVCEDDPEPVAAALAEHLDAISLDPVDPAFPQASVGHEPARAQATADAVASRLGPADSLRTRRNLLHQESAEDGRDGQRFLAPSLVLLANPGTAGRPHPLLAFEAPFPFAAVCRADPDGDVVAMLRQASRFVSTYRPPDRVPHDEGVA